MSTRRPVQPAPTTFVGPSDDSSPTPLPAALLTLARVAELISCHERTLRRWIASGRLRAYRLPCGWRVDPVDLQHFLDRHGTGSTERDLVGRDVK